MKKILIMGLPGSGKTTLANALISLFCRANHSVFWLNADHVRTLYKDWDFSEQGRIRQSNRMRDLADKRTEDFVVCDFVAPLPQMRENFNPDFIIWVDTITEGRYKDTNAIFVQPEHVDIHVTEKDAKKWALKIFDKVI